jgi:hypothetical protein
MVDMVPKQREHAWNKLDVPCDKTDGELFNASMIVSIGNGKKLSSSHQVG